MHSHSLMLYDQNSAALRYMLFLRDMHAQETDCFNTGG